MLLFASKVSALHDLLETIGHQVVEQARLVHGELAVLFQNGGTQSLRNASEINEVDVALKASQVLSAGAEVFRLAKTMLAPFIQFGGGHRLLTLTFNQEGVIVAENVGNAVAFITLDDMSEEVVFAVTAINELLVQGAVLLDLGASVQLDLQQVLVGAHNNHVAVRTVNGCQHGHEVISFGSIDFQNLVRQVFFEFSFELIEYLMETIPVEGVLLLLLLAVLFVLREILLAPIVAPVNADHNLVCILLQLFFQVQNLVEGQMAKQSNVNLILGLSMVVNRIRYDDL